MSYNDVGAVKAIDYPQPLGQEAFGVTYDYDAHGYRIGVRDKATSDPYWQLTELDDAGRYADERFGNGTKTLRAYHQHKQALKSISTSWGMTNIQNLAYEWDERLNLKSRTDARQSTNTTERFKYDALNRNPVKSHVTEQGILLAIMSWADIPIGLPPNPLRARRWKRRNGVRVATVWNMYCVGSLTLPWRLARS